MQEPAAGRDARAREWSWRKGNFHFSLFPLKLKENEADLRDRSETDREGDTDISRPPGPGAHGLTRSFRLFDSLTELPGIIL